MHDIDLACIASVVGGVFAVSNADLLPKGWEFIFRRALETLRQTCRPKQLRAFLYFIIVDASITEHQQGLYDVRAY